MLGHLLEGSLEYEGTTRRGTDTPVHHPEKRAGYTHSSTSGLSPREQLERQEESHPPEKTRPDSSGESDMGPGDPCRPWRETLGPGHKPR